MNPTLEKELAAAETMNNDWRLDANSRPQVLVDGPSEKEDQAVPRHAAGLSYMSLTGIVIPKLPRAIGHSALKKKWEEHEVEKKWYESNFAKSRERSIRRRQLSDFERFKAMRLRKQVREKAIENCIASSSVRY